ncbi:MAG: hypothetical protein KDD41_01690 [Flavobacteriales bacterium]|nr:hypothetical protein [Flavobacteriales bacterium]
MKRLFPLLIILAFLASCASSSKELETGDYDAALKKSAKKISKNPGNFEEVEVFNDAYRMANKRDHAAINQLKQKGDPANWGKIYGLYMKLKSHQDLALSLPSVGVQFQEIDYSSEINTARNNAAEYAYAKGDELMAKNDRMEARKAFNFYNESKGFIPDFKDVDEKIAAAKRAGMTNVFFRIEDHAEMLVPQEMMQQIQSVDVNDLDKGWVNYDSFIDTTLLYHYSVILSVKLIEVTPDQLDKNSALEKKEVPDGFDYVLDANGNVTKDSLGNDIKIPRFKTIQCTVTRYHQTKAARITSDMEYYDNGTDQLLKKEPLTSESLFENFYLLTLGNVEALSEQSKKELNSKPLPYPYDDAMVIQAGETMKAMAKDILVKNKDFLK